MKRPRPDASAQDWARFLGELGTWKSPPEDVLDAAARVPGIAIPSEAVETVEVEWSAPDVRGSGAALAGEAQVVARSCPGADLSVMAIPPVGDGQWRIEGRVWLRQPSSQAIDVVLVHDDHVLSQTSLRDGGRFRMDELLPARWRIEFHLPDGTVLTMEDPFA